MDDLGRLMINVTICGEIVDENHVERGNDNENLFDTLIIVWHSAFFIFYGLPSIASFF